MSVNHPVKAQLKRLQWSMLGLAALAIVLLGSYRVLVQGHALGEELPGSVAAIAVAAALIWLFFHLICRLYDQTLREQEKLTLLQRVSQAISSTLDLKELLSLVMNTVIETLEVEAGSLLLRDEQSDDLVFEVVVGPIGSEMAGKRVPPGKGIVGAVVSSSRPLIVNDVRQDPRWYKGLDQDTGFQTQSILCVPLLARGRVIGAVEAVNKRDGLRFGAEERELLTAIASQAALAIENARRYSIADAGLTRRIQEMDVINEINRTISASLDLETTLKTILECIKGLVDYGAAEINLWEPEQNCLVTKEFIGPYVSSGATYRPGEGYSGWIAVHRQPLLVQDAALHPVKPKAERKEWSFTSFVGVPLLIGDTFIGTLELARFTEAQPYSDEDVRILQTVADQAAIAIQNANLYAEAQRNLEELSTLFETGSLVSSTLQLSDLLPTIVQKMAETMRAEGCALFSWEPREDSLTVIAEHTTPAGQPLGEGRIYHLANYPTTEKLLRTRQPVISTDPAAEAVPQGCILLQGRDTGVALGLPLVARDEVLGLLGFYAGAGRHWAESDVRLGQTLANQIAVALDNARLYATTDERLREQLDERAGLERISQEINATLNLEYILNIVLDEAMRATGADQGSLYLLNAETGDLQANALRGFSPQDRELLTKREWHHGEGIIGRVLASGEMALVPDVAEDPDYFCFAEDTHSELAVPIIHAGAVAGVINLESHLYDAFSADDARFLQALVSMASLAIGNARTYTEQVQQRELLGRRAEQLARLAEVSQAFRGDRPLEMLLEDIVYAIEETIGFNIVILRVVEDDKLPLSATAGVPLPEREEMERAECRLADLEQLMRPEFRISQSFLVAHDHKEDISCLSPYKPFPGHHEVAPGEWHPDDILIVPLHGTEGQLLGYISLDDPRNRLMPPLDVVETLEIFAGQAAIAIENARLLAEEQRRRRLSESLGELAEVISSSLDLNEVMEALLHNISLVIPYDSARIMFIDENDRDSVRITATRGYEAYGVSEAEIQQAVYSLQATANLRHMARTRLPTIVSDTTQAPGWVLTSIHRHVRCSMGAPLIAHGRVFGFLVLDKAAPNFYHAEHVEALINFAPQAAIAISNARLYQAERARHREAEALRRAALALTSTISPDLVLGRILAELQDVVPYDSASVQLLKGDKLEIIGGRGFPNLADLLGVSFPARGDSPNALVMESREPVIIDDVRPHYAAFSEEPHAGANIHGWLGVPLLIGDRLIGMLALDKQEAGFYNEDYAQTAMAYAAQAAIALENARLYQDERARHGLLRTLIDNLPDLVFVKDTESRFVINNTAHLRALRATTQEEVVGKTDFDIFPHDLAAQYYADEQAVVQTGQPLANREEQYIDPTGEMRWLSTTKVPLRDSQGEIVGLVGVSRDITEHRRDEEVRERRLVEMAILNETGQAISATLDADALLDLVYRQVSQVMDTSGEFYVALYEEKADEVTFAFRARQSQISLYDGKRSGGNGLTEYVIRTRKPLLIRRNVAEELKELGIEMLGPLAQSWLGVPMVAGDRVLGVVAVQSYTTPGLYDEDHLSLLSTIANQVAIGLENIHLLETTRQRADEMSLLYDLGVAVTATLNLEEVMNLVAGNVLRLIGAQVAIINVQDEEAGRFVRAVAADPPELSPYLEDRQPRPDGLTKAILKSGQPIAIEDASQDGRVSEAVLKVGIKSILGVPVSLAQQVVGAVFVNTTEPRRFTGRDTALLSFLATQAAVAIRNAQLYERISRFTEELEERVEERTEALAKALSDLTVERDRVETLYRITSELSASLDLDRVLMEALALINEAVGVSRGSIMLLDPSTGYLTYRTALGRRKPLPRGGQPTKYKAGVGLAGWVLEHREAVIVEDVAQDPRWLSTPGEEEERENKSAIVVPLGAGEDVLGVLLLFHPEAGFFTEAHLKLVSAAAHQVATAINNAELYRLITDQAERLGLMLRTQQAEASKSQAIVESITDGVMVLDSYSRVILMNPATEDILGVSAPLLMNQHIRHLLGLGETQQHRDIGFKLFSELLPRIEKILAGEQEAATGQFRLESGPTAVVVNLAPVVLETGESPSVVAVLRDISREAEIDRMKNEFISTVSHELRTPMTSIKGYTDLLVTEAAGGLNETQRRFLSIIKSNADRLTALVSDILDISRIETGRVKLDIRPQEIGKIIHEVVASMESVALEKDQTLELRLPEKLPSVRGDHDRITQILVNLVGNACNYTPSGGHVTIAAMELEDSLQVNVSDNGIGISKEDQEKIFDRFYRSDQPEVQASSGTGLGLSIVKMFVDMMGGRLWVESELGKGSTFSFTLPLTTAEELPPIEVPELEELEVEEILPDRFRGKRPKILVVDDDRDIAGLLRHQLELEGYQVLTAYNGPDALWLAREERPNLITLDILMEGVDGFAVLEDLKGDATTAGIPVIIVSIMAGEEDRAFALGAVDYIIKPLEKSQLLQSVWHVLGPLKDGQSNQVLAVDDDQDILSWLKEELTNNGYEVSLASSGREALAQARRQRPDIILLDLKLPDMDGYQIIRLLKREKRTQEVPIIVITASAIDKEKDKVRVLDLGARQMLSKPLSIDTLVKEIKRVEKEADLSY
jgi:PAS domain S-box-containing protein